MPREDPTEVQNVTDALASIPAVRSVILFGSRARGEYSATSDIDLVVIVDDPELSPTALLAAMPERARRLPVSLLVYTRDDFAEMYDDGTLFFVHIRREGQLLFDRIGDTGELLNRAFAPKVAVKDELEAELYRLRAYDDLERFNDNFLFVFSQLYAIGKSVAILANAKRGIYEFRRERLFDTFATEFPEASADVEAVEQLRPFYNIVTRRPSEHLPFPSHGTLEHAQRAVRAVHRMAEVTAGA